MWDVHRSSGTKTDNPTKFYFQFSADIGKRGNESVLFLSCKGGANPHSCLYSFPYHALVGSENFTHDL